MKHTIKFSSPQFITALIGSWLVIAGLTGLIARSDADSTQNNSTGTNANTTLRVVPGTQRPASSIQQLQGAQGLQGQSQGGLQQPGVADQLQPNAKTDTFTETDDVQ